MRFPLLTALMAGLIAAMAPARAEILIDTDCAGPTHTVRIEDAANNKHITGALPAGWDDNSSFNKTITVRYETLTEGGRRFLRATNVSGGQAQMQYLMPDLKTDAIYDFTLVARSAVGASIQLGIRYQGAPYTMPWAIRPPLTPKWQTFTYRFSLPRQPQPVGIWFVMGQPGSIDVAKMRLERRTRDELIADQRRTIRDEPGINLVRCSRFPLGLQSGWALDREVDDASVVAATDPGTIGPSGAPALHLRSGAPLRLTTAPFAVPWTFEKHVASIALRGTAAGKLVVVGDAGRWLAETRLAAGPEWQRVQVPFDPVFMGRVHGLRIEMQGELWLDAMQVELGSTATAYKPPAAYEVALACPPSPTAVARVQFTDEPAAVQWCVTGRGAAAVLRAQVVDLYGIARPLPPVRLKPAFLNRGALSLPLPAARPLGAFRVEAWVEDAAGKRISTPNELVVYRLRRPRYWGKDAPGSPFGIHTEAATRHLLMAKAVGMNWARLHDAGVEYIGWSFLEPEKGKWTFYDDVLRRYRRNGLMLLGMLSTSPGWASSLGRPANEYFDRYIEPTDMDAWSGYVRTVAARYRGLMDAYEVWNEPWGDFWRVVDQKGQFVRSATPEADYARILALAYPAAKQADPAVRIAGFNTTGDWTGPDWTAGVYKNGGLESCDIFSYHHYTSDLNGYPHDDVERCLNASIGPIVKAGAKVNKPIWMSEGSATMDALDHGIYRYTVPGAPVEDVDNASNRSCRFIVSLLSQRVEKLFLYSMHSQDYFAEAPGQWRALVTAEGYLHPCAAAVSNLTWLLEDTKYVRTAKVAEGVWAYLFSGKRGAVAVLAAQPVHAAYRVPAGALDLYGNAVPGGTAIGANVAYLTAPSLSALEKRAAVR